MEKPKLPVKPKPVPKESSITDTSKRIVWDSGSSLYDSFELKSFEKQLDSAISSRSLSMPHLSNGRLPAPQPPKKKKGSRISRSIKRIIRSFFRPKNKSASNVKDFSRGEEFYVVYDDKSGGSLRPIPEVSEFDGLLMYSPELRSLVRKTKSDRFTTSATTALEISIA